MRYGNPMTIVALTAWYHIWRANCAAVGKRESVQNVFTLDVWEDFLDEYDNESHMSGTGAETSTKDPWIVLLLQSQR